MQEQQHKREYACMRVFAKHWAMRTKENNARLNAIVGIADNRALEQLLTGSSVAQLEDENFDLTVEAEDLRLRVHRLGEKIAMQDKTIRQLCILAFFMGCVLVCSSLALVAWVIYGGHR